MAQPIKVVVMIVPILCRKLMLIPGNGKMVMASLGQLPISRMVILGLQLRKVVMAMCALILLLGTALSTTMFIPLHSKAAPITGTIRSAKLGMKTALPQRLPRERLTKLTGFILVKSIPMQKSPLCVTKTGILRVLLVAAQIVME